MNDELSVIESISQQHLMTCPTFSFTVPGKPEQRGSKQPFLIRNKRGQMVRRGGGVITNPNDRSQQPLIALPDDNKNSKRYMALVESIACQQWGRDPIMGAVIVEFVFAFSRPKNHYGTGKNSKTLKASAPVFHAKRPDLAKLIRGAEDAITKAQVWKDDSQVVCYGNTRKVYTEREPFTFISITPLQADDHQLF